MILLDTHTLIWWMEKSEKLSKRAKSLIEKEKKSGVIFISSISVWELCLLFVKRKLNLSTELDTFLNDIENLPFFQFVPIDNAIAVDSVMLPGEFHKDPADRMIVATAREKGLTLVTGDEKIRKYPHVKTLW